MNEYPTANSGHVSWSMRGGKGTKKWGAHRPEGTRNAGEQQIVSEGKDKKNAKHLSSSLFGHSRIRQEEK